MKSELARDLLERMRKVEGQAKGIQRMLEEDRPYDDILIQLAAMREAINRVGVKMIGAQMEDCVRAAVEQGTDCQAALERAVETFLRFS